ncbi:response regulator [Candidatus Sumerlaeota bacterium]|nr:response regulator [Candidatus Sumerlaeota bacterium]
MSAPRGPWRKLRVTKPKDSRRVFWLPLLSALVGMAVTFAVSAMLLSSERKLMTDYTNTSAESLRNFVKSSIELRTVATRGFAHRWELESETTNQVWRNEAEDFLSEIDGLQSLEWMDANGEMRWRVPEGISGPGALQLLKESNGGAGGKPEALSLPGISGPTDLTMGGRGFLVISPISRDQQPRGAIVAVFRYRELFDTVFKDASRDIQIQVLHDGQMVYQRNVEGELQDAITRDSGFSLENSNWLVSVQPTAGALGQRVVKSSLWVFLLGLLISTLFATRMRSLIIASESEKQAKAALAALEHETEIREKAQKSFLSLVESTSVVTGEQFFPALVKALCEFLDVPICFLAELNPHTPRTMKILALWMDGKSEYMPFKEIENTPCEQVIWHRSAFYASHVRDLFPKEAMLQQLGIESYYGTTLSDSSGALTGLLSVMDRKVMDENSPAKYILPLLAARCAAELERLHAKNALAYSERIYRGAIENASGVPYLHLYDPEEYDFVGDGVRQLLGIEPKDFVPGWVRKRIMEVHINEPGTMDDPASYGSRFRSGEITNYRVDFRIVLDNGEEKWIADSSVLLRDEITGEPYGDLGVMQDITARKHAEQALRLHAQEIAQWKRRYDAAVEASGQVLYDWDSRTGIITWGNFFEVTFGYPPSTAHSKRSWWESVIHPHDVTRYREVIMDALTTRNPFKLSYRVARSDGRYIHIEDSGSFFLTADGALDRLVGFISDITSRVHEDERQRALESKIQQAQKLESLGVLAGGIAHDFNNLLVAIMGNAGLAMMELEETSPARSILASIERASQRAADLANQMLAYSGRGRFVVERIDLNSLVDEMTHLLEISISKKAIIQYRLAKNLPSIKADVTQIRQIIMNLVTNASDAIAEGGGTITVSTGMLYADGDYLRQAASQIDLQENYYTYVEVSDTGCGMDRQTQQRIFEPFFTTKTTGRGLGLAALLGIVRGHKGAVRVQSEPGIGTTIRVLFPSAGASSSDPAPITPPSNNVEPAPRPFADGGLVLIVDDEESVRTVTANVLEKFGYSVISASDGQEAVEIFLNRHAELAAVLMDMSMPRMDGAEAFREMRRIDPEACIILSSGYSEQEAIDRFAGKGVSGFIQKPYRAGELVEKVRVILRARCITTKNE